MNVVPGASERLRASNGRPDWDAVAELWQALPPQTLWRRHSDEVNSRLVRDWIPTGLGTVLKTDLWDEAAGEGLYPELAGHARHVVGVDVSDQVIQTARRRYPDLEAVRAEVQALPLAPASVDAVVSNSTLDHFETHAEIDASVAELARVLRPGGTLLLTLDNPLNPLVAVSKAIPLGRLNRAWLRLGPLSAKLGFLPYHVGVTYGRRSLLGVLARANLRVEGETWLVHSPRILAVFVAHALERRGSPGVQARLLSALRSAERLGDLPTRSFTGHFYGVRATRL